MGDKKADLPKSAQDAQHERRFRDIVSKAEKGRDKPSEKSQSELFREKAREIGADRSGATDEVMKRLASQKRSAPKK